MLNVLTDGPFRYIHCAATGELILTLSKVSGGFVEEYDNGEAAPQSLRHWKAIARKRIGDLLITDNDY